MVPPGAVVVVLISRSPLGRVVSVRISVRMPGISEVWMPLKVLKDSVVSVVPMILVKWRWGTAGSFVGLETRQVWVRGPDV